MSTPEKPPKDPNAGERPRWYRFAWFLGRPPDLSDRQWKVLGLVSIVSLFEAYDLYLFSLNLKQIQAELAIAEGDLGSLVRAGALGAIHTCGWGLAALILPVVAWLAFPPVATSCRAARPARRNRAAHPRGSVIIEQRENRAGALRGIRWAHARLIEVLQMSDLRVIDADGHVFEPESVWETYLDPKYRERRPRLVRDNRDTTRYMLEGRLIPPGEGLGAWAPEGIFEATTHRDGGFDPKLRLHDMDTEGIDVAVLYGSFGLALWQAQDPAFATALCRAYNDWLGEYCSADPTRLKGIPALPFQDVSEALVEGRRAVRELGMVGFNLLSNLQGRGADHPSLRPIYALACDLGVPVTFHAGGGQFVETRLDNYAISHTMAFPFDIMYGLACTLCGGVMERFPDLRVAFLEAGCGFFPYFLDRLDEHFEKRRGEMPIPRKPSEYVEQGRVLVSCEPDERSLAWAVESVGSDKILYASDYPHWDCEFPDSVRMIRDRPELDEATKRRILGENAAAFFGL